MGSVAVSMMSRLVVYHHMAAGCSWLLARWLIDRRWRDYSANGVGGGGVIHYTCMVNDVLVDSISIADHKILDEGELDDFLVRRHPNSRSL